MELRSQSTMRNRRVNSSWRRWLSLSIGGLLLATFAGCGGGEDILPVTGVVKYADGTIPKGEIAVVTFTPDKLGSGLKTKGASGDIKPDGTFRLSAIGGSDGAYPGKYKVTVKVLKAYTSPVNLVAKKYDSIDTTPLNAEIKSGQQHFEFVLDKQ